MYFSFFPFSILILSCQTSPFSNSKTKPLSLMPPTSPPPPPTPPSPLHATTLPSPPFPSPRSITSVLPSPPPFSSLAVFLSNSTALLYPSLPLLTPSLPSSPPITLPSPSLPSLSTFSFIQPSNALLFISFSPTVPIAYHYHLSSNQFKPVPLQFKPDLFSPLPPFGLGLGFRVRSSQNILAIQSVAASQIWLLFVCLKEKSGEMVVELKKCAVVQLVHPVYEMCLGLGCLILGERGGVRGFHLRSMIKGTEGKGGESTVKKGKGMINGMVDHSTNKNNSKLRTVKVKQNSGEYFSFFVSFNEGSSMKSENGNDAPQLARAISIHPFSKKTFVVLDSSGDLHFINLPSNSVMGPNYQCNKAPRDFCTAQLDIAVKVRLLAVLPNFSTNHSIMCGDMCARVSTHIGRSEAQIIWGSDGHYLLKMVSASGMENGDSAGDTTDRKLKSVEILASETIFTSGKIRDIVPISSSAVLVLTQENIYAYGTV